MKKVFISILVALLSVPSFVFADNYEEEKLEPLPELPNLMPARYRIYFDLDHETGDYVICPNYNITDLQITITQYGVVLEDTTVSLSAGQPFMGTFNGYAVGEYILTLTNSDGDIIRQYRITVLDD